GGSCFPKDVKALIATAEGAGVELKVLKAVESANERQKGVLASKVVRRFGDDLRGRKFAIWGLAFKAETDDMREAPSLVLIAELVRRGATIVAYDPVAMPAARPLLNTVPAVTFASNAAEALNESDALLIVTDWKEFKSPDFDAIKSGLKQPVVIDGRNLYEPRMMQSLGIEYIGIGRGLPRHDDAGLPIASS
ncbi:MAG: UDP binding domain-containing protein, partial [Caldimonas sp.]